MSHHGNEFNPAMLGMDLLNMKSYSEPTLLNELLKSEALKQKLGSTNKYPDGCIDPSDSGEIKFGCTLHDGKLILNFGEKPVKWIGFTKEEAINLGEYLIKKASEL